MQILPERMVENALMEIETKSSKYISAIIPDIFSKGIEKLLKAGLKSSQSELIRCAVREYLAREYENIEKFQFDIKEGRVPIRVYIKDYKDIIETLIGEKKMYFAEAEIFRCAIREHLESELLKAVSNGKLNSEKGNENLKDDSFEIKYITLKMDTNINTNQYFSVEIPKCYDNAIQELINIGETPNRSKFICQAIQEYLAKEIEAMKFLDSEVAGKKSVSARFEDELEDMSKLIGVRGIYTGWSELIRCAVRKYLIKELKEAMRRGKIPYPEKYSKTEIKRILFREEDNGFVEIPFITFDRNGEKVNDLKKYKIIRKLE